MALWDSEGMELLIEMVVASVAGLIGLWFLKKRSNRSTASRGSPDKPPSAS
jgi:hypothetical protein